MDDLSSEYVLIAMVESYLAGARAEHAVFWVVQPLLERHWIVCDALALQVVQDGHRDAGDLVHVSTPTGSLVVRIKRTFVVFCDISHVLCRLQSDGAVLVLVPVLGDTHVLVLVNDSCV